MVLGYVCAFVWRRSLPLSLSLSLSLYSTKYTVFYGHIPKFLQNRAIKLSKEWKRKEEWGGGERMNWTWAFFFFLQRTTIKRELFDHAQMRQQMCFVLSLAALQAKRKITTHKHTLKISYYYLCFSLFFWWFVDMCVLYKILIYKKANEQMREKRRKWRPFLVFISDKRQKREKKKKSTFRKQLDKAIDFHFKNI